MKIATILLSDDGKIIETGGYAESVLGEDRYDLIGIPISELLQVDKEGRSDCFSYLKNSIGEKIVVTNAIDGRSLEVAVIAEPEFARDAMKLIVSSVSTQNDLLDKREKLLAMFCHDIRSPLNSVMGFLQLLQMGTYGNLESQGAKSLEIAERSTRRMISMAETLLAFESMKSGMIRLNIGNTCLVEVIEKALTAIDLQARKKNLRFKFDLPTSVKIAADAERLIQVVFNLLDNAVKNAPEGSQITIKLEGFADSYEISVCDLGPGIAPQYQELIFKPFFQIDSSGGGFGLGLALCRTLIEQHGGKIGVISEPGAGSIFWFKVPRVQTVENFIPSLKSDSVKGESINSMSSSN
ncbi:hypothetical protein GC174_17235 [bacterium]|nr:hypothetical protein [bacterium]